MASAYPGSLDSLATNKANATATATDHPAHHNDLADAVNKIEAELGVAPSGAAATVAARFTALDTAVAAASIPEALLYPYAHIPGETGHAADDFFATFTGYTTTTLSGTVTWAAAMGGLGVKFAGIAANNVSAVLKAVPAAGVPITIETAFTMVNSRESNPGAGLLFSDGTVSGSNLAGFGTLDEGNANLYKAFPGGTFGTVASNLGGFYGGLVPAPMFIRAVWSAANTFEVAWSPNGSIWTDFSLTTYARTFTPTHMGLWVSNWSSANQSAAVFHYLRVYEADLSV